jgi:opacity protein-like surface antigen
MYLNSTYTDDGSDFGFNYGIETGYEFTSGVVVSGGYRASSVEIDVEGGGELDLDFDSFYVGVEYHFGP